MNVLEWIGFAVAILVGIGLILYAVGALKVKASMDGNSKQPALSDDELVDLAVANGYDITNPREVPPTYEMHRAVAFGRAVVRAHAAKQI